MTRENEQSIITSSGSDNEIRRLTEALEYFSGDLDFYPKGSCNWTIAKVHLKGIRDRLEELGVDEIISPDSLNGCGRPRTGVSQDIEGGKNLAVEEEREIDNGLDRITTKRRLMRWSPK